MKTCLIVIGCFLFQSEAVRMVRQRPLQRSKDDLLDLLEQMSAALPDTMTHCLHDKPFLHDLYDLKTVLTQSSESSS